ncbi:MAG TPA: tautomerase family protein [Geminicoccus sp.]|jgi:4-oxalocrotonate tautomerase|uniref:tautomerase family protein n=1 Tax=Geminicoccus sp. TaxID=2024832 RepID=UPI002E315538|nr:tautomerase family protein [Geminicoccus sp.]HEX2527169.1 tautomerase family protein [Geminicoccus sp.]
MPMIKVEMFSGRGAEQKRRLVKALTDAYVEVCGGKPQSVHIILADIDRGDWAIGGELCSDLYPDTAPAAAPAKTE